MINTNPLIIDAQLLQTGAWDRGMGHYCRALLASFVPAEKDSPITIIVNKNLPLDDARRGMLQTLLPGADIVALDLPTLSGDIVEAKIKATDKLDEFLAHSYSGLTVNFLILQLFTFDYCAAFPTHARKFVICYDLIPLIHWQQFSGMFAARLYFPHLQTLLEADQIFAISETTKRQLQEQLSVPAESVTNLNGAYIQRPRSKQLDSVAKGTRFVLMPSADLPHKNNQVAVQAFAKFNREFGDIFSLVMTSTMSEDTQRLLSCYSKNLLFTGNVSDAELEDLYERSEALLFVSSIEGLGLPILEAVHHSKPVVCSSIDVFKEISKTAFYYCEQDSVDSIAKALGAALIRSNWDEKVAEYQTIKDAYTWSESARRLAEAIQTSSPSSLKKARSKAQIVLPHPSTTSGELGSIVQSIAPSLARNFKLSCYVASDQYVDEQVKPYFLPHVTAAQSIDRLFSRQQLHRPVYFIDDTSASRDVVRAALVRPGICYITTDDAANALSGMVKMGYVTADMAENTVALCENSLAALLISAGNQAYSFAAGVQTKLEFKVTDKDKLAAHISEQINKERT